VVVLYMGRSAECSIMFNAVNKIAEVLTTDSDVMQCVCSILI
jgi:hypothetical protein